LPLISSLNSWTFSTDVVLFTIGLFMSRPKLDVFPFF
jgi:hypothetical protein